MDMDLRDVHYLTGLVDGLLLAKKLVQTAEVDWTQVETVVRGLSSAKAEQVFDMYVAPYEDLRDHLSQFERVFGK